MSRGRRTALLLACAHMAVGCPSSPSTTFIRLQTIEPARTFERAADTRVGVGRVELPPELDRSALVRHEEDNRLEVVSTVRWPAPLDDMVQRTLAFDLERRLPAGTVALPGDAGPKPEHVFAVTVQTFALGPGDEVVLHAHWSLLDRQTQDRLLANETRYTVPAASDAGGDVAAAMSVALGRLADDMAAALQ